jgi:hypothetical protein
MVLRFRELLALRIAAILCLVLGLFPYYAHKTVLTTEGGVPRPRSPGEAATPIQLTRTSFSVGLPFSPIYSHQSEERTEPLARKTPSPHESATTIKFQGMVISGDLRAVQATTSSSWRLEFFCWSTAVAVLGIGLLAASLIVKGK